MSIRTYKKDHPASPKDGATIQERHRAPTDNDPLVFWTNHPTENHLVDLRYLRDGHSRTSMSGRWKGQYTGRPNLIAQLAPQMQEDMVGLARKTAEAQQHAFREWWRLLDAVEKAATKAAQPISRVEDVRHLTEMHRQWAHDHGMRRTHFRMFVRKVNLTLDALGEPLLHWIAPKDVSPKRHLPPQSQIRVLRTELRHQWFKTLRRWELAEKLLSGERTPETEDEVSLLAHYRYYSSMQKKTGKALLTAVELYDGVSLLMFTQN